ncbi:Gfo/Idh/MocA family protein [Pseudobacter ginsenosidimutans]|uniref:Putative dehydrogenase n=1 Tax=Pseudobacter ginsenosidimutans TaxID=661488 RepID=A0A4V2EYR8_9BACT|nr:Gfo/Idh/MocA family oxidoreductase [Pseudobacter ginsenosidimutans]QEC42571.1 Gfo/Idh/MocA family oxidoreductase [Pseudobacter ginsenosidimutans]RZS63940.1 putative dehydrogenase [Pseudobacter ginsenosidimutans]
MVQFRNTRRAFIRSATQKISLLALGSQAIPALAEELEPVEELLPPEGILLEQPLAKEQIIAAKKLGIALVGLGGYAGGQLAPALQETEHCYLAGIVTGTPQKAADWKTKYNIPDKNIYNYENFDQIIDNKDIDIVYVVLPNAMHCEYVIRAAKAGKHVICEKPMAITVEECDRMIAACKDAGKMLSIGYRLHFEPYNQEMMRLGTKKIFGEIKTIEAHDGMGDTNGWRLDKKLAGGGPLMDVGIYCVQGCRYTTGLEPIAVTAVEGPKTKPEKFKDVEESLDWTLEFPGGIKAHCKTSYTKNMNLLQANAEKGWFKLSPAYPYRGQQGETSEGKMNFPSVNQQARQMDDFALAILEGRATPVPGEMGRQDVKILQAIYKAMETKKRVEIV